MNESTVDDEERQNKLPLIIGKIVRCLTVISDTLKSWEFKVLVKELNELLDLKAPTNREK